MYGARYFSALRTSRVAQTFLDGAGPAAIGAILGSAVLLAGTVAYWITDSLYLVQVANDTYSYPSPYDFGWTIAAALNDSLARLELLSFQLRTLDVHIRRLRQNAGGFECRNRRGSPYTSHR